MRLVARWVRVWYDSGQVLYSVAIDASVRRWRGLSGGKLIEVRWADVDHDVDKLNVEASWSKWR